MMGRSRLLTAIHVLMYLVLATNVSKANTAYWTRIDGKYLRKYTVRTKEARNEMHCIMLCFIKPWCSSVNYKVSGEKKGNCELNNKIWTDAAENDQLDVLEYIHFSISARQKGCSGEVRTPDTTSALAMSGLLNSTILKGKPEFIKNLTTWLNGETKWRLCYRASNDGWDGSTFHTKCDHKGPTVTIVKVDNSTGNGEDFIFGGYTDASWGDHTENITGFFTIAGGSGNIDANGAKVVDASGNWSVAVPFTLPANTGSLYIMTQRVNGVSPGILASFSTGEVTDSSWLFYRHGWRQQTKEYGQNVASNPTWRMKVANIATKAFWIWSNDTNLDDVHCYKILRYRESSNSFIFSLRNNDDLPPFKAPVKPDKSQHAIYTRSDFGPVFGDGFDFFIEGQNGYSYFGQTYQLPPGYTAGGANAKTLLAGSYNFAPSQVEVFFLDSNEGN